MDEQRVREIVQEELAAWQRRTSSTLQTKASINTKDLADQVAAELSRRANINNPFMSSQLTGTVFRAAPPQSDSNVD